MIQTDPKSKIKIIFYIMSMSIIIILLFLVTIAGLDVIINEKGKHPIIMLFNIVADLNLEEIVFGTFGFGFLGYAAIGTFILITLSIFLLLSKMDSNLRQIEWTKSNYLPEKIYDWLNVSLSTFVLTILSVMVSIILITIFYSYRYLLKLE